MIIDVKVKKNVMMNVQNFQKHLVRKRQIPKGLLSEMTIPEGNCIQGSTMLTW